MKKYILLSFDHEEFDLPLEYKQEIDSKDQFQVSQEGLQRLMLRLDQYPVRCTFFTTAAYAEVFETEIKSISRNHEIASHACTHTGFQQGDYLKSRLSLEKITGQPVTGFRMPRLAAVDTDAIKNAGYQYDSSIHPAWIPGRYNHRHLPESTYIENGLVRVPCSVSPSPVRFPLFWLSFKNFPLQMYTYWLDKTLARHDVACLYFHPWEYADIGKYKIPYLVKSMDGQRLLGRLSRLIEQYIKQGVEFLSIREYLDVKRLIPDRDPMVH